MSVDKSGLTPDKITFAAACRENTGAHMLDSGGAYGRQHEKPDIPEDIPVVLWDDVAWPPSLSLSRLLEATLEIDRTLQKEWSEWDDTQEDLNWFESGSGFMESKGYESQIRDNTYNHENDLSQDFVWDVFRKEDNPSLEWFYSDKEAVTIIHIHCGCDARGGHGRPLFCRATGEYQIPMDPVLGFDIFSTIGVDGEEIDYFGDPRLDEEWQIGYSGHPWYPMTRDIEGGENGLTREDGDDITTARATLLTGEKVFIRAVPPFEW